MLAQVQVIGVGRAPLQYLHRIDNALAGASDEVRVVLLAYADGLRFTQYSQPPEAIENLPKVHCRARRADNLRFGLDDGHANPGLREAESGDKADWSAADDDHIFHRTQSETGRAVGIRIASSIRTRDVC